MIQYISRYYDDDNDIDNNNNNINDKSIVGI